MFEPLVTRRRRVPSLAVSLGIHTALVVLLVVPPLWAVQEPCEPETRVPSFIPFRPPEELLPATFESHRTTGDPLGGRPGAAPRRSSAPPTQPTDIGVLPPPVEGQEDSHDITGEPAEGPAGPGNGPDLTNVPAGDPSGGGAPIDAHTRGVTTPVPTFTPSPRYPEAARLAHLQGAVFLEAIIDADGTVRDVRVLRSVNALLDGAALEAVRRWKYRAARIGERAVSVYLDVKIEFVLH